MFVRKFDDMTGESKLSPLFLMTILLLVLLFLLVILKNKEPLPELHPLEVAHYTGSPKVYSTEVKKWIDVQRGMQLYSGDKIKLDEASELDLKRDGIFVLRLKPNTDLELKTEKVTGENFGYSLYMQRGDLLGVTDKGFDPSFDAFKVASPLLEGVISGNRFYLSSDENQSYSLIASLSGDIAVNSKPSFGADIQSETVKSMQKAWIRVGESMNSPVRVSQDEWKIMKEAYDLIPKSAAYEAGQLDLSKKAGELYKKNIFDHGTFFTPKIGYANRDFIEDQETGNVYLEIEYDVFPRGSYVGIYNKTRAFDISKFQGFRFDARRKPGENFPNWLRIELKSRGSIVRTFAAKHFRHEWKMQEFKFQASKPTNVTEITFVISHEKVGAHKKGFLQLRNFDLVPLSEEEIQRRAEQRNKKVEKKVIIEKEPVVTKVSVEPISNTNDDLDQMINELDQIQATTQKVVEQVNNTDLPKKVSIEEIPVLRG